MPSVTIIGMPLPHSEKIRNIKALREAWILPGVLDSAGQQQHIGLKESKQVVDGICLVGYHTVDLPDEVIERLVRAGFKLDGYVPGAAANEAHKTTLVAVRQLIQEALDQDDPDMVEATLPAYRLALKRVEGAPPFPKGDF